MNNAPDCYGRMFPSIAAMEHNKPVSGNVFGYQVQLPGIAVTRRGTTVNADAWRQCVACPEFESCYRLSTGRLLMEMAVRP